jgi:hypothetical protein
LRQNSLNRKMNFSFIDKIHRLFLEILSIIWIRQRNKRRRARIFSVSCTGSCALGAQAARGQPGSRSPADAA